MGLLKWAAIFAVVSLIAAIFGFGGLSEGAAGIAKVLFFIFLAITALLVMLGLFIGRKISGR